MADYLFVPQSVLDRWSEQGKVQVDGYVLTLLDGSATKVFALTAAVRFLKMEAGEDVMGLLHKVKTIDALKQMAAEHYLESVIIGDSAYQVQQGFLADAAAIRRAAGQSTPGIPTDARPPATDAKPAPAPAKPAAPPAATAAKPAPAKPVASDPDLAQFFLDKLR